LFNPFRVEGHIAISSNPRVETRGYSRFNPRWGFESIVIAFLKNLNFKNRE
jgi:hypothetical protein